MDEDSLKSWLLQKHKAESELRRLSAELMKHADGIIKIGERLRIYAQCADGSNLKPLPKELGMDKHLDVNMVRELVAKIDTQHSLLMESWKMLGV